MDHTTTTTLSLFLLLLSNAIIAQSTRDHEGNNIKFIHNIHVLRFNAISDKEYADYPEFKIMACVVRYVTLVRDIQRYVSIFLNQATYCFKSYNIHHLEFPVNCPICQIPHVGPISTSKRAEICQSDNLYRMLTRMDEIEFATYRFNIDCKNIIRANCQRKEFKQCWRCVTDIPDNNSTSLTSPSTTTTTTARTTESTTELTTVSTSTTTQPPSTRPPCTNGDVKGDEKKQRVYYECVNGEWKYKVCEEGELFKKATEPIRPGKSIHCECIEKWNRAIKDNKDERKYEQCINRIWIIKVCPPGMKYDANYKMCIAIF